MIAHIIGRRSRGFSDVVREQARHRRAATRDARRLSGATKPRRRRPRRCIAARWSAWRVCSAAGAPRWRGCSLAFNRMAAARSASRASRSRSPRPRDAIAAGIALVPEDRARQGFVAFHSVESNIDSAQPRPAVEEDVGRQRQGGSARRQARSSGCASRPTARKAPVRSLSGGNAAEGRHRQMAGDRTRRADPRRADRRHRHRVEVARSSR